jgi:rod shape-determining protein MreC
VLRLSIQARQAIARLTLPVLIVLSLAIMLVGRASPYVPERARTALSDALAPIYAVLAVPIETARDGAADIADVFILRSENERLRAENERLRRWYDVAMALDAENATLKANLRWIPDPALAYVTARVASMPAPCCFPSAPITPSAKARSRLTPTAWLAASPKSAPAALACCY